MIPEPLLSVGRDCDCGHPLVWVRGEQRCAVYGQHRPYVHLRDHAAPCAPLIELLLEHAATQRRRNTRLRIVS